jgi:segregation and condensation protein B
VTDRSVEPGEGHGTAVGPGIPVGPGRPDDAPTEAAPPEATPVVELTEAALEALLFVAERPLNRREIAAIAGVDRATVDARLGDLEVSLAGRGIRLVVDNERVELATAPEAGRLIAAYVGADAVRLSPASLETLAIVAYRQPITKAGIERIRGVDTDYTIRVLLHRRLVVELGRSDSPGRPYLYGTSLDFLERFGLTSIEELPPLDVDVAARLAEEGGLDAVAGAAGGDDAAGADGTTADAPGVGDGGTSRGDAPGPSPTG